MEPFLMFGKYSMDAMGKISAERTKNAAAIIGDLGGEVKAAYALLGETDLVFIVELPGVKEAMKASVELAKLLGISFSSSSAITVEEFDRAMREV